MQNIKNNIKEVNDLDYKLKIEYNNALKDPYVKKLCDSINLSDDELMKYTSSFEDASKEYKNCCNCKNLIECKNSFLGYCYLPVLNNNNLSFSYVACKYKNKYINENKYLDNVLSINVPKEIKEAKIKDIYTDDKNRASTIKWILNYIKDAKKNKFNKGLFLHGNFGCGKTYLISAMFNELAKSNIKSAIVYWPEYLRSLKESFQSSSNDEFKNKFNDIKYAKLLLIDDLGAEAVSSWNRDEILGTILQYRMQEDLPTFITSNLNIKELEEHLSVTSTNRLEKVKAKRIIERINQLTIDTLMIGENNRK